jgi:hypothetical protein
MCFVLRKGVGGRAIQNGAGTGCGDGRIEGFESGCAGGREEAGAGDGGGDAGAAAYFPAPSVGERLL